VKLIETVQKVFSWCGYPLLVDAENWMAHRGAAQVILNIFRHTRTPETTWCCRGCALFLRLRSADPTPQGRATDLADHQQRHQERIPPRPAGMVRSPRWLYSPRSPLNWLTKRRRMRIVPYVPEHAEAGERLWNSAGIGQVFFNDQGQPRRSISTTPMVRRRRMVPPADEG
jgi:hypothetical protein